MSEQHQKTNLERLILEAARLSERNLESELAVALAADQRAISFCGFLVAAIAILVGTVELDELKWNMIASISCLVVALVASGFSSRSVKMYAPGAKFLDLKPDIDEGRDYCDVITDISKFNDKHSSYNRDIIKKNSKMFKLSMFFAIFGFLLALTPIAERLIRSENNQAHLSEGTLK